MNANSLKKALKASPALNFIVRLSISLICLGWVVYLLVDIDTGSVHTVFKNISIFYVFYSLLTVVFLYLTRLIRLKYWILKFQQTGILGMDWLDLYLKSIAFGALTPARLGDFSRIRLLSSTGITLQKRTKIVMAEKLWDMTYAPMAIFFSFHILNQKFQVPVLFSILTGCIMIVILGVLIYKIAGFLGSKAHGVALGLTLLGFLSYVWSNVLLFKSVGIGLDVLDIVVITTVMGVMASIPISLGGLGIREGTLLIFLQLWGISREMAFPLVYLEFFVNIIFPILLYLPMYLIHKKSRSPKPLPR